MKVVCSALGLTQLADVSTLPLFLESELKEKGYSRIKSASYCLQFAEKINKIDAIKIYQHLIKTRTLPDEKYLREIAESALSKNRMVSFILGDAKH